MTMDAIYASILTHKPKNRWTIWASYTDIIEYANSLFKGFPGSWDAYLPLAEFAYNNSFKASISMAPSLWSRMNPFF